MALTQTQKLLYKQFNPAKLEEIEAASAAKHKETMDFVAGVLAALDLDEKDVLLTEASKKAALEKSTTDSPQAHYTANQDEIAKKIRLSEVIKNDMAKSKSK